MLAHITGKEDTGGNSKPWLRFKDFFIIRLRLNTWNY